ncbi:insulinase family protein [Pseudoalteromonas sp. SMS1]|uniref:insulinase family protein n=1 Tax=Pseudoalteromonas sp. SMS1 TaxID=2908894 RepID=UPI001F3ADE0F|nr:insulinase family protein [Pseudoalteromonas sp. SMS1]MCF2856067.1 insulinase family protein [Pseudoalteromonas sp. SMS1]
MKKLFALGAISLGLLAGCSATHFSSSHSPLFAESLVVSPNDDRQYRVLTLENGIDVVLVSDPSAEKSAAALSVGVGLLHDPMSQQGMAHYLEHMLFLGTEQFPDPDEYSEFMQRNGGSHNAYTWLDVTNYMLKINNDAYDEALERFSDFFKAPKLYPEYTDKEKNAVNAEWSMRREMDFFGQFKLARSLLGEHPANRFLIGNLETLGDKPHSNLHQETVKFYDQYYSANIMKLALVSNLPLSEMEVKAVKHFSSIKNKRIEEPVVTNKINFDNAGKKRIHYRPNQDVKSLNIEFIIENNQSDFAVKPNYFITYLLSNEMQGSPAQLLKDKGWIASLGAYDSPNHYGNYGVINVGIELTEEGMKRREEIVATVMQYINLIKDTGVDAKYFEEIKTSLDNQFRFLEKQDEFDYVSDLAANMQDYPLNHAVNASYHFAKFDPKAINQVLNQLTPETMRIWYISKDEPVDSKLHFYDGQYKVDSISDREIANWSRSSELAMALPSINRLLPENFDIKLAQSNANDEVVQVYKGERVHAWRKSSERFVHQPKGTLEVVINSETPVQSIETRVAAQLWVDLYQINKAKLITEAQVAGMGLNLSYANGLVMSLSGFTDKQSLLLEQAFVDFKVSPTKKQLDQAVDRFVRQIQNQNKQIPYYQAFGAYRRLTRGGNFDHELLIETAKKMTPESFTQYQGKILGENLVRVFGYGNYSDSDISHVVKLLEKEIGDTASQAKYVRTGYWQPKKGEVLVWQQDADVADVAIVDVAVHPKSGYEQKAAALILKAHLRQKAFNTLRTEEQLAYAVGALSTNIDDYSAIGLFIQTPVKSAQQMQKRFDEFKLSYAQELAKLSEEEFTKIKSSVLANLMEEPKNLAEEAQPILSDWYRNQLSFDSKQKLVEAAKDVSLENVKEYLNETLLNDDAARLNIQIRGKKFADQPFATLPNQKLITSLSELYQQATFK